MRLNAVCVACALIAVSWAVAQDRPKLPQPPEKQPPIQDPIKLPKAEPAQKLVRAERIEIADKDGTTRMSMGVNKDSLSEFVMLNKSGKPVCRMAQLNDHQWLMTVSNDEGTPLVQISTGQNNSEIITYSKKEGGGTAEVRISNTQGTSGFHWKGSNSVGMTASFSEKGRLDLNGVKGGSNFTWYTLENGEWYSPR
jgi:hypothetical protein